MSDVLVEKTALFVRKVGNAESAELDVAWDAIHQAGWPADRMRIHRFVNERRAQLVITEGPGVIAPLPVFEVQTVLAGLEIRVESRWLAAIPPGPTAMTRDAAVASICRSHGFDALDVRREHGHIYVDVTIRGEILAYSAEERDGSFEPRMLYEVFERACFDASLPLAGQRPAVNHTPALEALLR